MYLLVTSPIFITIALVAIISCTPFWLFLDRKLKELINSGNQLMHQWGTRFYQVGEVISVFLGLYISSFLIITDTYSSFIYFQF